MNRSNRKTKLSTYEVVIKREIEHTAVVTVEARSLEEAQDIAKVNADAADSRYWREGDVLSETVKGKLVR